MWRRIKKYPGKRLAVCFLAALSFFMGIREFISMPEENSLSVFLEGAYPDQNRVKEIFRNNRKQEEPSDICFYWDGGFMEAEETGYGHQTEVYVAGLTGNARLYDWNLGGLAEEDHEGCVISRQIAEELFGTKNAVGNCLTLNRKTYIVRQVLPWKENILVLRPQEKDTVYTRLFLKMQEKETSVTKAEQFLAENSLDGIMNRQILKDWIPDQWSDFGFWMKKWKEVKMAFQWYLMLPKTVAQTQRLIQILRGLGAFVLSLLLYIWQKKKA